MPITNIRQGTGVRIALKEQSAQGVPIEYFEILDNDILRAEDVDIDPNVQIIAQTGLTGSPYEQDEGATLVGLEPTADLTVKASPQSINLFLKSLLGLDPALVGNSRTYSGFVIGIPFYFSLFYDTTLEAFRLPDMWFHTVEFNSRASENLIMNVSGQSFDFEQVASQFSNQFLSNFNTYSHKESTIEDGLGGSPVELFASEQTLRIEHGNITTRGNSVAPNFIGKDGRIAVSGTITTRLSDETAVFFSRALNLFRTNLVYRYVDQFGNNLTMTMQNVTVTARPPRINADGTMADLEIEWVARQMGSDEYPFTIVVEE